MTAPSKTFSAPTDAQIAPDAPADTTLWTQVRDALIHLEEWIGKDYTAAQNHNHDGVNSASLDIGIDFIRNGGFETNSTSGWSETIYTGGTIATGTAGSVSGVYAAAITSTVIANGGGQLLMDQFIPCEGGQKKGFRLMMQASAANVSSQAEVVWYNAAQEQISEDDIYLTSNTPTTSRLVVRRIAAPATARFCRVRLTGGVPTLGTGVGTIYFDAVDIGYPALLGGEQVFTASGTFSAIWGDVYAEVQGGGGEGFDGTWAGANGGTSSFGSISATGGAGGTGGGAAAGGVGSGGSVSFAGQSPTNTNDGGVTWIGGNSHLGYGGAGGSGNGIAYGGGGGGSGGFAGANSAGAGGGYASGLVITSSDITVVVAATADNGTSTAGTGAPGLVRVRW